MRDAFSFHTVHCVYVSSFFLHSADASADLRAELETTRARLSEKQSQYHALQKKTVALETKARIYQQKAAAASKAASTDDAENESDVANY